jgi:Caenorhabditis protein of unknown function, DUF268
MFSKASLKNRIGRPLLSIGINPLATASLRYFPKYLRDRAKFEKAGGRILCSVPILADFNVEAGTAKGHYFHQDLLVASFIADVEPERHIDVGSRVDGFVAHVASFREIEVLDVRALESTGHRNIKFLQADLMIDDVNRHAIADSVSCLHAIEHFGLGRYGDSIDPAGHLIGYKNILKMVKPGGALYISFPIGDAPGVYFNAHRVFHPKEILTWPGSEVLELMRFDFVDDSGNFHPNFPLHEKLPSANYGCGIYSFLKTS